MSDDFRLVSFMRRGSANVLGIDARIRYCMIGNAQPLVLHREPSNQASPDAVRVTDLVGQPVGYVAREDAPLISAKLAAGEVLLCRTDGPCQCLMRQILIWSEGKEEVKATKRNSVRRKELIDG